MNMNQNWLFYPHQKCGHLVPSGREMDVRDASVRPRKSVGRKTAAWHLYSSLCLRSAVSLSRRYDGKMSRKAIKAINWAALAERIPETEKTAFAAFKAKSDQYLRRMTANPETPPKIDWAYYKKNITLSGLVDKFQKEYDSISVPYPTDKYTSQIESQEKEVFVQIEQFIKESNERISTATKEAERVKSLLPFSEMTMEDFRDLYPEQALNPDKPTVWPHTPDVQPENEKGRPSHH